MIFKRRNYPLTDDLLVHFPIKYNNSLQVPIQVEVHPHDVLIRCYANYSPELLEPYSLYEFKTIHKFSIVRSSIPDDVLSTKPEGYSYADAIEEGIKRYWEGSYEMPWYSFYRSNEIPVKIEFIRITDPQAVYAPTQHFARFYFAPKHSSSSYVKSSPKRRFWGILRNFTLESVDLNWSCSHPGSMYLKRYTSLEDFQRVVAHEFGHMLGIGDAYGASYRLFYQASGTSSFMMCHGHMVHPQEIEMVLTAHYTNSLQCFPVKLSLRSIIQTFRRNLL